MAFKSFSVALATSNTDVVECPATQQGAAVIGISNITAGALTYALKLYRQATGQTVTLATGVSVPANTAVKFPAPISLEAGDKIIMTSSSANNLLATGAFTYSAATPAAVGFTPLGAWDDEATYAVNDVVSLDGNSYLSRQDDNLNQNPGTETDYWALLAEKGETGDGDMNAANNLSDLTDKLDAILNLSAEAAPAALVDAAPVAVDWLAAINFTLTVTAARQIGNPANGQPGTWRTILVQGNDGTDRAITFGNQFGGSVPTITDCDNVKKYLLSLYCKTTSQFLVFAANGSDA
jgi:hypothetical protein